ncbi:hypothetical protein VB636_01340 [Paracoccus sp. APAP_BH8]
MLGLEAERTLRDQGTSWKLNPSSMTAKRPEESAIRRPQMPTT